MIKKMNQKMIKDAVRTQVTEVSLDIDYDESLNCFLAGTSIVSP